MGLDKSKLLATIIAPLYLIMSIISPTYVFAYGESLSVLQQEITNVIDINNNPVNKIIYNTLINHYKKWVLHADKKISNTKGTEKEKEYKFKLYLIASINAKIAKIERIKSKYTKNQIVTDALTYINKILKGIVKQELQNAIKYKRIYYPNTNISNINSDIIKYEKSNWNNSLWVLNRGISNNITNINKINNTTSNNNGNVKKIPSLSNLISNFSGGRRTNKTSNSGKTHRFIVNFKNSNKTVYENKVSNTKNVRNSIPQAVKDYNELSRTNFNNKYKPVLPGFS